jgi:hypothetical protein
MVAVRCPHDFDHPMRKASGQWKPGSRRWLVERRRIGPVIRALEATTDPPVGGPASAGARTPIRSPNKKAGCDAGLSANYRVWNYTKRPIRPPVLPRYAW